MKKIIHLFTKTDNRFSNVPLRFDRKNITSRGGLFIFAKFLDRIGLYKILEKDLSLTIRKNGKQTKQPIIGRIYSLILCITAGSFRMYRTKQLMLRQHEILNISQAWKQRDELLKSCGEDERRKSYVDHDGMRSLHPWC